MIYIFTGGPSAGKSTACKTLANTSSCFKHISFDFCTQKEWDDSYKVMDKYWELYDKVKSLYSSRHSIVIDAHMFMLPMILHTFRKFAKAISLTVIKVPDSSEAIQRYLANPEWGSISDTNIKNFGLIHHYVSELKNGGDRIFVHTSEFSPLSWTVVFTY